MARLVQRSAAFKEAVQMCDDKGGNEPFSDAESKYIMHLVGTKNDYREIASVLRRK